VELIAELQDFFASYVVPRYRGIDREDYRLLLLDTGQEILRGVHPSLAEKARERLWHEGIEIRTGTRVTRVGAGFVEVNGGETIPVGMTVWAAGVKGHPTLAGLAAERDRLGRVIVNTHMRLPGHPEVYGVGDAVTIEGRPKASIPIIPAALAHARLAAHNIVAELAGLPPATIEFAPRGMLVSLGEKHAVVEVMGLRVSGYPAWLFWNALHLLKLVGIRKQIQVALDWSLARWFPRDSAIMRNVSRCPVCSHTLPARRDAA
ncbi:MAG TPA: FAD-dependent oxidoreductase, partial [Methylomirabilota bacterium]|nr:FAD-dependent oxidoreductase [Methylomirabilota bacterium]